MRITKGELTWDISAIARSLVLTPEEVRAYFTDGRRVSFVLERRIAKEVMRGTLAASEGAGYDVLDPQGRKWEVRSITRRGMYFCPSYMVGSGRSFQEAGFRRKLSSVEGYVLSDVESFPRVPYWIVSRRLVKKWYEGNEIGATTKISRKRILELLSRAG